nr:23S rRNA (adenine(2503)-C(2))-methyltransferase RlmN [bacterium endosymbiont of Pedicinus badii]
MKSNFMNKKINFFSADKKQLKKIFISIEEKSFRAEQMMQWIYKKLNKNIEKNSNFSKKLKIFIKDNFTFNLPDLIKEKNSFDKTIKWIFKIEKQKIETIYIPEKNRATLCISSQIGCLVGCQFCATGMQGFNRNLETSEIIGQIWIAKKIIKNRSLKKKMHPITNIVFMGMGEPLLNLPNITKAISIIKDKNGFSISKRRITISTVGIPKGIDQLRLLKIDVILAISLHAPNEKIRSIIIPFSKKYSIHSILKSAERYRIFSKANKKILTIEYIMIKNINDKKEHALELSKILKSQFFKINLIPFNPFFGSFYQRSDLNNVKNFANILKKKNFFVTIRKVRGEDIQASCGQLVGKVINKISLK